VIGFKLPNDRIVYDKVSRKDKDRLTEYGKIPLWYLPPILNVN